MIKKLEISSQHTETGVQLQKYIAKKIGQLDRYVGRRARQSVHAEVKLKEAKVKGKQRYTCEVILRLPEETLHITETAINMFAAVDIVESKLKIQLKKYKDLHVESTFHRKLVRRLKKRFVPAQ